MGEVDADTVESLQGQDCTCPQPLRLSYISARRRGGTWLGVVADGLSQVGAQISDPNRDILNTYIHDTELFSIQKMPSCSD